MARYRFARPVPSVGSRHALLPGTEPGRLSAVAADRVLLAEDGGVAGLTRLLACEWAAKGVQVNAIAPGYVATNNTEALRADEKRSADILGRIPAGRWGKPSDIGGAAVFLASAASDYVNGIVLPVDGGWLAR
mgnify:CR=1 FL=1